MTHLKEYSEKLVHLVQIAEKDPAKLEEEKKKVEFNYIVEDLPRLIKSCEDGALRTRDIVLGLRNFSRLDESSLKEVDIEEGINNTLQLLSGELKTRIKVHLDLSGLPKIKCYASQINQVFMNILTNAAQAIDVKGDIFISTKLSDQNAVITIKDNGPGIPANVLGKIFDRNHRILIREFSTYKNITLYIDCLCRISKYIHKYLIYLTRIALDFW
jgi:two-component system NtrC family sensor kinase